MFDLSLFRLRAFTGVSIATLAIGGGMFAVFPYLTLYLQNVLGLSPLQGGAAAAARDAAGLSRADPDAPGHRRRVPAGLLLGLGLAITALGPRRDEPASTTTRAGRRSSPASSSPASGSASPTRRSRRSRSASCRRTGAAWPRGSATRSGSAGSRAASPRSAPSSSTGCRRARGGGPHPGQCARQRRRLGRAERGGGAPPGRRTAAVLDHGARRVRLRARRASCSSVPAIVAVGCALGVRARAQPRPRPRAGAERRLAAPDRRLAEPETAYRLGSFPLDLDPIPVDFGSEICYI